MRAHLAFALRALLFALLAGCGRCSPSGEGDPGGGPQGSGSAGASSASIAAPSLLPPPKPITLSKLRGLTSVAMPIGCSLRAPITHAPLPSSARFVAEPRSLGQLIIADSAGDPPVLTGVAALTLDPDGPTRDPKAIPWVEAASLPRIARSPSGAWLAALERGAGGTEHRIDLWREGSMELMGQGDQLEAASLACGERRCALLTSRLGKVAGPGAEAWFGGADERASAWKRVQLAPSPGESDARPLSVAAVDPSLIAALLGRRHVVFRIVDDPAGPREIARLPSPHGVLDVIAAPDPIAMTLATAVDESGCASFKEALDEEEEEADHEERGPHEATTGGADDGGPGAVATAEIAAPGAVVGTGLAGLRIERPSLAATEIRTAAPPLRGALRRLNRGALAVWIAPLGCQTSRRVVYAVVLDEKGSLTADIIPISDADRFAAASSGSSVDLWIEREGALIWIPMTCGAP